MPRIKPGTAGWEAQTLPLCNAVPLEKNLWGQFLELIVILAMSYINPFSSVTLPGPTPNVTDSRLLVDYGVLKLHLFSLKHLKNK